MADAAEPLNVSEFEALAENRLAFGRLTLRPGVTVRNLEVSGRLDTSNWGPDPSVFDDVHNLLAINRSLVTSTGALRAG